MATGAKFAFARAFRWRRWRTAIACISIYILTLNAFLGTALASRIAASDV
jgi:hypothetical protein